MEKQQEYQELAWFYALQYRQCHKAADREGAEHNKAQVEYWLAQTQN